MAQPCYLRRCTSIVVLVTLVAIAVTAGNGLLQEALTQGSAVKVQDPSVVLLSLMPPAKKLTIVRARYGARDSWIDVTDKLNQGVQSNRLAFHASNSVAGDPVFGVVKSLEVDYVLDGQLGKASVGEGGYLCLPPVVWTGQRLIEFVRQCPAQVSFFGRNFTNGRTIELNPDRPVCLASIVKVFDLLEVIRQADHGKIHLSDTIRIAGNKEEKTVAINEALDLMIGRSDNDATDALARLIGYSVNCTSRRSTISVAMVVLPLPTGLWTALDSRDTGLLVLLEAVSS